jgi:tRNA 2-thiouridine synthesizing protein A
MAAIKTINACGLSCPQPALLTRQALGNVTSGTVHIQVDSVSARDNVARIGQNAGWQVSIENSFSPVRTRRQLHILIPPIGRLFIHSFIALLLQCLKQIEA